MKKYLPLVILAASMGIAPFPPRLLAQPECFLQGENGQHLDLSNLCGRGNSPAPSRSNSRSYIIPINRRQMGIPVVEVTFNGQQRFEMLFDTGASGIAMTESMAETIGVRKEKTGVANTAGGNIVYHTGRVSSVRAGNLLKQNLEVGIVPDLDGLGLLGQNFFGDYDVIIREKVIELRRR